MTARNRVTGLVEPISLYGSYQVTLFQSWHVSNAILVTLYSCVGPIILSVSHIILKSVDVSVVLKICTTDGQG